ncbi:helix-turn-helix transcriptional regulator [Eubacterium sp. 1001713B170207_170306_E7]|uniref:helix-turn-helix domain-containing protein n=1 Tax=Eubacterium sp. 1001713B170207_170306_E7 TaxID=2787097 RepID=UPI0018987F41|nr:helix-turn-helix transcriptional regulator [Eubacterium sp. 1001713B170207_170306_E7]
MNIGEFIKEIRKKEGLTQKEFAEKLGLVQATISAYEKGIRSPTFKVMIDISEIFGVDLNLLMSKDVELVKAFKDAEIVHEQLSLKGFEYDYFNDSDSKYDYVELKMPARGSDNYLNILNFMSDLNEDGQKKALDLMVLLRKIPEYRRK